MQYDNRNYTLSDARGHHKTTVSFIGSWPNIKRLDLIIAIIIHNTTTKSGHKIIACILHLLVNCKPTNKYKL